MPKVSVIIPIFGVEKYIERCARSLFEQTLDDIEYIFVNDCTKDNSINILLKILENYPERKGQVTIVNHTYNKGLPQARKTGIKLAKGEYIVHCDSDDWLDTKAYEDMWQVAKSNDYDIIFCDYYNSDGINHLHNNNHIKMCLNKGNITLDVIKNISWTLWRVMVKQTIYNNKIIYPTENNGEDFALMCQLLHYSEKTQYIKKPYYYYFNNTNSISNQPSIESFFERIEQHKQNIKVLEEFYADKQVDRSNEIIILKLIAIAKIYSFDKKLRNKKYWANLFPEINKEFILFNMQIPSNLKIIYYEMKYNLYNTFKFIRKLKSVLIRM